MPHRGQEALLHGRAKEAGERVRREKGSQKKIAPPVEYKADELAAAVGVTQDEYSAFREAVAGIESGGKYGLMGGAGGHFAGRYQMGAIGHPELAETARSLGEPPPSIKEFLNNPQMQERYFERYTLNHHRWLMQNSAEYRALTPEQKLAALGYAHNQGAGFGRGAAGWLRTGVAGSDAFGTSGGAYPRAIMSALARERKATQIAKANPEIDLSWFSPISIAQAAQREPAWVKHLSKLAENAPTFLNPRLAHPIGHTTHHNIRYGNHSALNQKTNIVVNAASDPGAMARQIAGIQGGVNSTAIRNLQGASQ